MTKIRISDDLTMPVDAATQTFLVVGKRGSGKSTTAARIVEQLLKAKIPVVVFDPVDSWYGLKASRDGKGEGYGIYVFGGRHKDVDLEPGAGALIAEFLCEHRAPLILSCKHLSGLERSRFMVDFAMTLYRKWTGGVLHLLLEEAHELAPQNPPKGEKAEEMLGAFKKLWKLGRSSGIGGTAVTQRPASLSKDITTQSEILVVHRTIGPQDVEAVRQWIKYHHQGEEILPELATLKTGEAFVWAPEFPEDQPIGLRRVQVLPRETFDSASTPKAGEKREEPKDLAPVDIERLRSKMASTIERQKAEDPRELRKTIAEQSRTIKALEAEAAKVPAGKAPKTVEKPVLKDAQIRRLEAAVAHVVDYGERAIARIREQFEAVSNREGEVLRAAQEIKAALAAARDTQRGAAGRILAADGRSRAAVPHLSSAPVVRAPRAVAPTNGHGDLTGPEQRILDSLAWLESIGNTKPHNTAVAGLANYNAEGGAYCNPRGRLSAKGLIVYHDGGRLALTDAGRALANRPEGDLTPEEIQTRVLGRLAGPEQRILKPLLQAYPSGMTNEDLAAKANYNAEGGAYCNPRGRLKTLGLIRYEGGLVYAQPVLFLEGA